MSLIRLEQNTSYAHANNRGAASARGDYICFMNNDVEVLPGWLPPLYEVIDGDVNVGAVGPKLIFPDGSIQFAGYEMNPETGFQRHRFRDARVHHSIPEANVAGPVTNLTGACLLVRKEDACFDERYWYGCEDADLCVQLKQKNKIVFYQPESVVIHHEEKTRSSGLMAVDFERNREIVQKEVGKQLEAVFVAGGQVIYPAPGRTCDYEDWIFLRSILSADHGKICPWIQPGAGA